MTTTFFLIGSLLIFDQGVHQSNDDYCMIITASDSRSGSSEQLTLVSKGDVIQVKYLNAERNVPQKGKDGSPIYNPVSKVIREETFKGSGKSIQLAFQKICISVDSTAIENEKQAMKRFWSTPVVSVVLIGPGNEICSATIWTKKQKSNLILGEDLKHIFKEFYQNTFSKGELMGILFISAK